MQPINTEQQQQQQANARLPRQLPANTIKEITSPIHQKHTNKNTKLSPNRSDKLTGENHQKSQVRPLQTDLGDFDTHRSLSSCPTYSSLSRHSPETRECATQITTLTPIETIEDNQEILNDSPIPIDNNPVLLVDEIPFEEVELMPISNGFGYYPYHYPTTRTDRILQPQIVARAPKFRSDLQDKSRNGFNGNSKIQRNGKSPPPRPTAVKRSPRSDAGALPTQKNEINKVPKNNSVTNGSRRIPPKENVVRNSSPSPEKKHSEPTRRNGVTRPVQKYVSTPPINQEDLGRKPLNFIDKHNNSYYPSSPPAYYRKPAPAPRDEFDGPQRMHIANNEYVVQRRRQLPSDYIYDDRRMSSPIERTRPRRVVRVLRDPSYREDDDDVYYVEPAPPRRAPVFRRSPPTVVRRPPPPTEYVYADEAPVQIRHRRPRRPEVVYVDEDQPAEHEDDYIYVDEDGNEVDFNDEQNQSEDYVEYIYDDEKDKRRSHKSKVVYVEDDAPPINYERIKRRSKQPSSTRIVYQ